MPVPFVETGSYPTRAGNRIDHLIDGESAFRRICEAIECARETVWATITFMWSSFQMPDGRGLALDVLDRAVRRGVDVRLIFWRPDDETANLRPNAFWGSAEHLELLSRYDSRIGIRWDRAQPGYCQHQKSWLVDANRDDATCFIGSANLNPRSVVRPGHSGVGRYRDVFVELAGPCVVDVHHNFVQRWNEASERAHPNGHWGHSGGADLRFPDHGPPPCGQTLAQIQRTIHSGRYTNGHPSPNGSSFDIAGGETTILDQYVAAIAAATRTIYIENQYLNVSTVIDALSAASDRGVHVVAVLPPDPPSLPFPTRGLVERGLDGARQPVHVHSKLMLVDDEWATVGSCNLHRYSLYGNAELNVAFSDAGAVCSLRDALMEQHAGVSTHELSDVDRLAH